MGWTGIPNTRLKTTKGLNDFFSSELLDFNTKIIDLSKTGNVFYVAVQKEDSRKVWCLVIFLSQEKNKFLFKEMDETEGLCSYDCPVRILNKLSPTANKNALIWRELCRKNAERKKVFEN